MGLTTPSWKRKELAVHKTRWVTITSGKVESQGYKITFRAPPPLFLLYSPINCGIVSDFDIFMEAAIFDLYIYSTHVITHPVRNKITTKPIWLQVLTKRCCLWLFQRKIVRIQCTIYKGVIVENCQLRITSVYVSVVYKAETVFMDSLFKPR